MQTLGPRELLSSLCWLVQCWSTDTCPGWATLHFNKKPVNAIVQPRAQWKSDLLSVETVASITCTGLMWNVGPDLRRRSTNVRSSKEHLNQGHFVPLPNRSSDVQIWRKETALQLVVSWQWMVRACGRAGAKHWDNDLAILLEQCHRTCRQTCQKQILLHPHAHACPLSSLCNVPMMCTKRPHQAIRQGL